MKRAAFDTKKEVVDRHYENQWKGYTENEVLRRIENLTNVIDPIISRLTLKDSARILDIGSGPGIIPLRIAQLFGKDSKVRVYGIDSSKNAVRLGNKVIAKSKLNDSIHLIRGDAENIPFQCSVFDAVVSNATINLLQNKDRGFNEMARVTKDEGSIVIGDCIAKESKRCCEIPETNDRLWSVCVAGAPTKEEFREFARRADLEIFDTANLTEEVFRLVKNKLWDWPEFIEYELHYYIFGMRKSA